MLRSRALCIASLILILLAGQALAGPLGKGIKAGFVYSKVTNDNVGDSGHKPGVAAGSRSRSHGRARSSSPGRGRAFTTVPRRLARSLSRTNTIFTPFFRRPQRYNLGGRREYNALPPGLSRKLRNHYNLFQSSWIGVPR